MMGNKNCFVQPLLDIITFTDVEAENDCVAVFEFDVNGDQVYVKVPLPPPGFNEKVTGAFIQTVSFGVIVFDNVIGVLDTLPLTATKALGLQPAIFV